MNYYAEIKSGYVSSILETNSLMVGDEFIAIDSHDVTLLGASYDDETSEFTRPQAQTHKIKGLSATEYRKLLTLTEQIRNDKARTHIDGDLAWLSGSVEPDDDAAAIGFAGATYRDLLRTVFKSFDDATAIDCDDPAVDLGLTVQSLIGLLDSPARKDVIKLGVPL